jgi:hypothetical protein
MRVADVKAGMKGFGLTVFTGSKIEKFDVEVIDVLKNFNPQHDVVLIRCLGPYMDHVGSVEGMSGSPIYLYDESGKAKLIGAFAYGWPLAKDPVAGVQPIEYMLALPDNMQANSEDTAQGDKSSPAGRPISTQNQAAIPQNHPHWSLDDVSVRPWGGAARRPSNLNFTDAHGNTIRLQPLATPLMTGGLSRAVLRQLEPLFQGDQLIPMQAGGTGTETDANAVVPKFQPGSVLAVPLLTGDADMTAIGTCTDVIGNRIFGFGHAFNGEGRIALPMGTGSISTVVANLEASFKLGTLSKATGTLTTDQTVGVAGTIGVIPPMVPIELHIVYADGSIDQTYHFSAAIHPKFTPMVIPAALGAALTGDKDLPEFNTLNYHLNLQFANGQNVTMDNTSVEDGAADIASDLNLLLTAAMENPFGRVQPTKLTGTINVSNQAKSAHILTIMVPRSKYEPGETVKAFITYEPFRAEEASMAVDLDLPRDLPNGTYQLAVTDSDQYFMDERQANPFKFSADNVTEMFDVLKDVVAIKHNALYLRLVRRPDGVAVGRTAMPRLPSSRRLVLTDAGRSDTVPFISSTVKVVPTDLVMSGSAVFSIVIEKHGKVETAPQGAGVKGPVGSKSDEANPDVNKPVGN